MNERECQAHRTHRVITRGTPAQVRADPNAQAVYLGETA